jgi:uncharacterized membrane protein
VRINEFIQSPKSTPESNLTTALELIRHRYKDKQQPPKISTQSLINLVLNTDKTFDYDALVAANENNPALKNLIKSYNKDYIELRSASEDDDTDTTTTNTPDNNTSQTPVDTVANMAKRAAKTRGAAI